MLINPNSDRDYINNTADIGLPLYYPSFLNSVKFERFRHITDLTIEFKSPITVITGSNKVGKTTILQTIACSHYNFNRRNVVNGSLERTTWGNVMKFTPADVQNGDWTYYISHRIGVTLHLNRRGQRKAATKRWNGIGKKESQIGTPKPHLGRETGRNVVLIDIERIVSAKSLPNTAFIKAQTPVLTPLSNTKKEYLSHILEQDYAVSTMCSISDKDLYSYTTDHQYSSYNTASGEDVLTRIVSDIVDAPSNSLILIEEIEIGLHPKIQRRLMDVIYYESRTNKKQFIITTHSGNVLSTVSNSSRIFIENNNGSYKAIPEISINAALSKMDAATYPLIDLFVEDDTAEKIVLKVIDHIITTYHLRHFSQLINIIKTGDADKTYNTFTVHRDVFDQKPIKCGFACILDGDKVAEQKRGGLKYPRQDGLFFLYDNKAPEKFLVHSYLQLHPNQALQYHIDKSNPHCLFNKMVENGIVGDRNGAFDICWNEFSATADGQSFINALSSFLIDRCKFFSPEL